MSHIIAPTFPLRIDQETGSYESHGVTDLTKVVNQNIKMVLLTCPGEKLFNLEFGVGLRNYLFKNDTEMIFGSDGLLPLRENIISQFSKFLPQLTIEELKINISSDKNLLSIKISYFVKHNELSGEFDLTIDEVDNNVI